MVREEIESFWDLAYRDGEHERYWEPRHPPQELVALIAAEVIPAGGTVLDLGCGAGRETIFLAQCGFRAIGIDASEEALKIARRRSETIALEIDWRLGDVRSLPLKASSVDFVTDRGLFHVIDREERPRVAQEIDRVLRPGGGILLRGAARDDEEEGLVGVDAAEIDRCFIACRFVRGPLVPIVLESCAGDLTGKLVVLEKRARPGDYPPATPSPPTVGRSDREQPLRDPRSRRDT